MNHKVILVLVIVVSAVGGYLAPLPAIPVAGKSLVLYPYEVAILAALPVAGFRTRFTPALAAAVVWIWLVGVSTLLQAFLGFLPFDIWLRSVLYTAKWAVATLAFFVGSNLSLNLEAARLVRKTTILAAVSLGLYCLVTQLTIFHIGSLAALTRFRLGYFEGLPGAISMINPNQLGQLLALASAMLVAENRSSLASTALLLAALLMMILTFSREALLTFLLFVLIGARPKKLVATLAVASALMAVVAVTTLEAAPGTFSAGRERLLSWLSPGTSVFQARVGAAWAPLWDVVQTSPILGVGPEGIQFMSRRVVGQLVYNGDNMILGSLAAYGILGLVGLLLFLLGFARTLGWWGRHLRGEFSFVGPYMLAYMITGLIAPHFLWPYNSINSLLLLMCGLFVGGNRVICARAAGGVNAPGEAGNRFALAQRS